MNGSTQNEHQKYNMFKTMSTCFTSEKRPSNEDISRISPFIFKRWLSNHPSGIMIGNMFNIYKDVPIINQFDFTKQIINAKVKYINIKYLKNIPDADEFSIKCLQRQYRIPYSVAIQYYNAMPEAEINKIVSAYKTLKGS